VHAAVAEAGESRFLTRGESALWLNLTGNTCLKGLNAVEHSWLTACDSNKLRRDLKAVAFGSNKDRRPGSLGHELYSFGLLVLM
jgi:hypothetical protein